MDEAIRLRHVRPDDLDDLARLYACLWCKRIPDEDDKMLVGHHCVLMQLVRSPLTIVAEQEWRIAGVCLGCVTRDGSAPRVNAWAPAYEAVHAQACERAKTADQHLESLLFDDQRELVRADDFIRSGNPYAQAELNLIMVEPQFKGRGLGSRMIDCMRELMRARGATRFFLMTDTASDFAFYVHRGMKSLARFADDSRAPETLDVLMFGGSL